jgi:hypothetical protein
MKKLSLLGIFSLLLFAASCNNDDDNDDNNTPTDTMTTPKLAYNYTFGGSTFNLDEYYALDGGAQAKFSLATFYISKPTMVDDADAETALMPEYIIVRPGDEPTTFEAIEAGGAQRLTFNLGIDEATNTEAGTGGVQPTDFSDPNYPLAPQPEGMYWSWASGYIFVKLEGAYDYDADGQADTTFKYHLGLNDLLPVKEEMLAAEMPAGGDFNMTMTIDLKEVFNNVNPATEVLTMTMGGPAPKALATKVINNFADGVSVETDS